MIAGVVRTLVKKKNSRLCSPPTVSRKRKGGIAFQSKNDTVKKQKKRQQTRCVVGIARPPRRPALPLSPHSPLVTIHSTDTNTACCGRGFCCWDEQRQHCVILQTFKLIFLLLVRLCSRVRSQDSHCVDMVALTQNKAVKKKMYFKFCLFLLYRNLFFFVQPWKRGV